MDIGKTGQKEKTEYFNHPNKQWLQQSKPDSAAKCVSVSRMGKNFLFKNLRKNNEAILCMFKRTPPKHEWQHRDTLKVLAGNLETELP